MLVPLVKTVRRKFPSSPSWQETISPSTLPAKLPLKPCHRICVVRKCILRLKAKLLVMKSVLIKKWNNWKLSNLLGVDNFVGGSVVGINICFSNCLVFWFSSLANLNSARLSFGFRMGFKFFRALSREHSFNLLCGPLCV